MPLQSVIPQPHFRQDSFLVTSLQGMIYSYSACHHFVLCILDDYKISKIMQFYEVVYGSKMKLVFHMRTVNNIPIFITFVNSLNLLRNKVHIYICSMRAIISS